MIFPTTSPGNHHATGVGLNRLSAEWSHGPAAAWAVSRPWFQLPTESVLIREPGSRAVSLSQMWQPRKPTGALGSHSANIALQRVRRAVSCVRPRRALARTLVTQKGREEKRHRYFESPKDVASKKLHPQLLTISQKAVVDPHTSSGPIPEFCLL